MIVLVWLWAGAGCSSFPRLREDQDRFSFLVAGHTYGSHKGINTGLYPKFLKKLHTKSLSTMAFLVLTGDIVRQATPESWQQVEKEISSLPFPVYFVKGNHDVSPGTDEFFHNKFGGTFYSIVKGPALLIVLDVQKEWGVVTPDQLRFLEDQIISHPLQSQVFIFFHELLWTSERPEYQGIHHNYTSYHGHFRSNYWEDLHPLLLRYPDKRFFLMAGDVAGNPGTIPAFYEERGPVTFIASGMGEIQNENFLKVDVSGNRVTFTLVPLNVPNTLKPLGSYTPQYFLSGGR